MIFPPAFLDSSSSWNSSHNQPQVQQTSRNTHIITTPPAGPGDGGANNSTHPHPQEGLIATLAGGDGGDGGSGDRNGDGGGGGGGRNSKPMSMPERARRARVPQPEPGLNCPRCDSTNTKFCYYNNYSLTQPRHFCRACHRYWTRGGALRDVPASRRYRRHAKRSAKPKAASAARAAAARTSSVTLTTPSTTAFATLTATEPSGLQYSMLGSTTTSGQFTDSFDPASLARLLFADGGVHHHHHQGNGNDMEQWAAVEMQSLPFLYAMDHQIAGPPAAAMPTTMAELQDMFHLGLHSGGSGHNGEDDRGHHQFHQDVRPPAKRDHHHQQQGDYPSSMYADIVNGGGCGYNYYSGTSNASGN